MGPTAPQSNAVGKEMVDLGAKEKVEAFIQHTKWLRGFQLHKAL